MGRGGLVWELVWGFGCLVVGFNFGFGRTKTTRNGTWVRFVHVPHFNNAQNS